MALLIVLTVLALCVLGSLGLFTYLTFKSETSA